MFADFDIDPEGMAFLVRISFDGYGCCTTGTNTTKMSLNESQTFIESVATDNLNRDEIRDILRRYFLQNDGVIWRDALEEHDLI